MGSALRSLVQAMGQRWGPPSGMWGAGPGAHTQESVLGGSTTLSGSEATEFPPPLPPCHPIPASRGSQQKHRHQISKVATPFHFSRENQTKGKWWASPHQAP